MFDENVLLKRNPSSPKISIVIPSYNKAQYIERTMLSILNQNYPNLELLVIDGDSTDGSLEIIRKYERFISFWISEKDDGQTSAINKGIKMATGELVGWQNAADDHLYLPGALPR
jgi:glycosyltransferase involved in cell wall biosynthesis